MKAQNEEIKALNELDSNVLKSFIIIDAAVKLAENLSSAAIIISGDFFYHEIETCIPVYFNTNSHKGFMNDVVLSNIQNSTKIFSEKIINHSYHRLEEIDNITAIEYIAGSVQDGNIVAIVGNIDSCAVVLHNLKENQIINKIKECEERVGPEVLRAVLSVCLEVSTKGREGKKVGTAFIIGDSEEVMQRSHPLIINPYLGQTAEDSNIIEKHNWESVLELSQLDGVFIVSEDGKIHAAGRYLDVDARDINIDKGLGGRHVSAAAITRDTVAIAVTVSESGGVIRIYKDGKELLYFSSVNRSCAYN